MGNSVEVALESGGYLPYEAPPTHPQNPGLHPPVHHADDESPKKGNRFKAGIEGPDPLLAGGDDQSYQQTVMVKLTGLANLPHIPFRDEMADGELEKLKPNPPQGKDGVDVTHAVYQSHIPGSSAESAYLHFVRQPSEVFGAAGLKMLPKTDGLANGAKYMLELEGPPKAWLPIQIHLDHTKHSIEIQTLDGHPLRGHQTFTFTNDGKGGCVLTQDAHYQASSSAVALVQQFQKIAEVQHDGWVHAHQEIYNSCHGKNKNPVLPVQGQDRYGYQLNHSGHPGHEMYRQAHAGVNQLNARHGIAASDRDKDFAASIAVIAKANGLDRVDHVLLSPDGNKVYVVQGDPQSVHRLMAHARVSDALSTPMSQSSMGWDQAAGQAQRQNPGPNGALNPPEKSGPVI